MRYPKVVSPIKLVPDDLILRVAKTLKTSRWQGEIFSDLTGQHIIRCVEKAEALPVSEAEKSLIKRLVVIHELPKPQVSESDIPLLEQWMKGEKALWGVWMGEVQAAAVIARILDLVDDLEIYHSQLTAWLVSNKYSVAKTPEERKIANTFDIGRMFWENIEGLNIEEEKVAMGRKILELALWWVVREWEKVPQERIGEAMIERLAWAEKNLGVFRPTEPGQDVTDPTGKQPSNHQ